MLWLRNLERHGAQELECLIGGSRDICMTGPRDGILRLGNWATLRMALEKKNTVRRPRTHPTKGWAHRD